MVRKRYAESTSKLRGDSPYSAITSGSRRRISFLTTSYHSLSRASIPGRFSTVIWPRLERISAALSDSPAASVTLSRRTPSMLATSSSVMQVLFAGKRSRLSGNQRIERVSWDNSMVFFDVSHNPIKQSPEYAGEPLPSREFETKLHGHLNRQGYRLD